MTLTLPATQSGNSRVDLVPSIRFFTCCNQRYDSECGARKAEWHFISDKRDCLEPWDQVRT